MLIDVERTTIKIVARWSYNSCWMSFVGNFTVNKHFFEWISHEERNSPHHSYWKASNKLSLIDRKTAKIVDGQRSAELVTATVRSVTRRWVCSTSKPFLTPDSPLPAHSIVHSLVHCLLQLGKVRIIPFFSCSRHVLTILSRSEKIQFDNSRHKRQGTDERRVC